MFFFLEKQIFNLFVFLQLDVKNNLDQLKNLCPPDLLGRDFTVKLEWRFYC